MQTVKKVPFFDYKFFKNSYGKEILDITQDILDRGAFIMQKDMYDFERRLADYLNVKHVFGVANCSDGLEIALQAAGIGVGDEVIFPAHTFIATAAAIVTNQATPVPVECGADHLIDLASVEAAITAKTKAIMPVQLNGRTCDMDKLTALAKKYNLMIIEDAAQALGSSFKGKKAGTFGLAAAFSFYPAKILGCLGDGGIIVTQDDAIADTIYQIRDHGRDRNGQIARWGRNSRLDTLQAAILNRIFDDYETIIERRREVASLYHSRLYGIEGLILPPAPNSSAEHFDVYQNYEIESFCRDALEKHLNENGVGTLRQWSGKAVHQFEALNFSQKLPFTEMMTSRELLIPMNMSITNEEVHYVCDQIEMFYEQVYTKQISTLTEAVE